MATTLGHVCTQPLLYLVVGDKDDFSHVVMHGRHGLRALVEDKVDLSFHLLTVRNTPNDFLYNLA